MIVISIEVREEIFEAMLALHAVHVAEDRRRGRKFKPEDEAKEILEAAIVSRFEETTGKRLGDFLGLDSLSRVARGWRRRRCTDKIAGVTPHLDYFGGGE